MATAKKKSSGGARAGQKKRAPAKKRAPRRRLSPMVQALICFALAVVTLLSLLPLEGFVLSWCFLGLSALLGPGVYLVPFCLLGAGGLLVFRGRDKHALRLAAVLLLPLLLGAIAHRYLPLGESLGWSWRLPGQLISSGQELASGGLLGGLLAMVMAAAFSPVGAMILLIALFLALVLIALDLTPAALWRAFRDFRAARQEGREEKRARREEERAAQPDPAPAAPARDRRRGAIDIPLDDAPAQKQPRNPADFLALLQQEEERERQQEKAAADLYEQDMIDPIDDMRTMVQQPADAPPWEPDELSAAPLRQGAPSAPAAVSAAAGAAAAGEGGGEGGDGRAPSVPAPYVYPPLTLLDAPRSAPADATAELRERSQRLLDTLLSFHIQAQIVGIVRGPSVTRFELQLPRGVKFSKLTALSEDIALALGSLSVRIAPIPDKVAVGVEVPNKNVQTVYIREVVGAAAFQNAQSRLSFAIGKDITGTAVVGDIAKMPHMLIAGTTGSGKSVCINSLLISLLYKSTPEEVRLIMVDPKMIELGGYNGIPHLLIPVVTDPKKASGALNWAVGEMMRRYQLFAARGVRDLASYNRSVRAAGGEEEPPLPQIVIVIDELADLMMVAAREVEDSICRIAQMARAAGMHLVIATQRPSADVITGIMKANIPSRIAFAVASQIESRIILDQTGAEKLIGKGDMLYAPLGGGKPVRIQGCFITSEEVERVVEHVKRNAGEPDYSQEVLDHIERQSAQEEGGGESGGGDEDPLLMDAIDIVVQSGQASVSLLQRKLKLGYARAARLVDQMEDRGIVGPFEGSKPRAVLIGREDWQEMKLRRMDD